MLNYFLYLFFKKTIFLFFVRFHLMEKSTAFLFRSSSFSWGFERINRFLSFNDEISGYRFNVLK